MTDIAYQNAVRRRGELLDQSKQLSERMNVVKSEIARIDRFIADWRVFSGEADFDGVVMPTPPSADGAPKSRNPRKEEVGDKVAEILSSQARPMMRPELFSALTHNGIELQGKDPPVILSTMLWRMKDRFVMLPGFGYWLADQPFYPAGYDPTQPDLLDVEEVV